MGCLAPAFRTVGDAIERFNVAMTYADDATLLAAVRFSAPAVGEPGWPTIQADQMNIDERVHAAWMYRLEACLQYLKIPVIALTVAVCGLALFFTWVVGGLMLPILIARPVLEVLEGWAFACGIGVTEIITILWGYCAVCIPLELGIRLYYHEAAPACFRIHQYAQHLFSEAARIS